MPVRRVPGGWRWGSHGRVYPTREQAEAQGRAAFANGYREDARSRHAMHRALSASKRAESGYVLAIQGVMRRTHASVLEHVGTARRDAEGDSDARFLRRLFRLQAPEVQRAFDAMASEVHRSTGRAAEKIIGIRAADVPGLGGVIAQARARNVRLIQGASEDFLRQVRETLEQFGSLHPGTGAGPERLATLLRAPKPGEEPEEPRDLTEALQARVGVSRSRAQLISRDQTTKLTANLNEHRQRAAGIRSFRWSTSNDSRVRDSHRELEGQVFSWDDPPTVDDEIATPGSPVRCRCVALPIIAELEEPASTEAEEPFAAAAEE